MHTSAMSEMHVSQPSAARAPASCLLSYFWVFHIIPIIYIFAKRVRALVRPCARSQYTLSQKTKRVVRFYVTVNTVTVTTLTYILVHFSVRTGTSP